MDLTTRYLGIDLPHPFMPGAGPLADDLDTVKRLEDAGAAAIVMRSLFEEQLEFEQMATAALADTISGSFAEADSFLPFPHDFALGPEAYLEQLVRIREAVDIPVIASLNGTEGGFWLQYARLIEQAGANAIELNIFDVETDMEISGSEVETRLLLMVDRLREHVEIPIAVKLSPFYTAPLNLARSLARKGADGLILFNRYFQADLDVANLEVERTMRLSDSSELPLRLRWLAILSARVQASMAVTGGVHSTEDAVKALMCGADVVQVVSMLLREGPGALSLLVSGLYNWLEVNEYESLDALRGSMNVSRCPDPSIYSRANYIQLLQSFKSGS